MYKHLLLICWRKLFSVTVQTFMKFPAMFQYVTCMCTFGCLLCMKTRILFLFHLMVNIYLHTSNTHNNLISISADTNIIPMTTCIDKYPCNMSANILSSTYSYHSAEGMDLEKNNGWGLQKRLPWTSMTLSLPHESVHRM